jgi:hypothetical protein
MDTGPLCSIAMVIKRRITQLWIAINARVLKCIELTTRTGPSRLLTESLMPYLDTPVFTSIHM